MKVVANNAKKSVTVSEDAHYCRYVPILRGELLLKSEMVGLKEGQLW
jgi:hypothetical protein